MDHATHEKEVWKKKLEEATTIEEYEEAKVHIDDPLSLHSLINSPQVLRHHLLTCGEDPVKVFHHVCNKRRIDLLEAFFPLVPMENFVNDPDGLFQSFVTGIISSGVVDVMTFLLDKGLDPNVRDFGDRPYVSFQIPLLSIACIYNKVDIVRLLLERGADPDLENRTGVTPIFYFLTGGGDINILRLLIMYGASLHHCDKNGANVWSSLILCTHREGVEEFYQCLVEYKVVPLVHNFCGELLKEEEFVSHIKKLIQSRNYLFSSVMADIRAPATKKIVLLIRAAFRGKQYDDMLADKNRRRKEKERIASESEVMQ